MNYEIIPQEIRGIINNQYPQINDEHKRQLAELWRILLQIGHVEQAMPQFLAFLQMEIENVNDSQTISDRIDAEIASLENPHPPPIQHRRPREPEANGGKRKRKSSKKRKGKSSRKNKKYSKKSYKKSSKKRK